MLALGLVLVLVAAALFVAVLVGGGDAAVVDLGALQVQTSVAGAFLFGAASVLLLVVGLALLRTGARRARRRRHDRKKLDRLSARLDERRGDTGDERRGGSESAATGTTTGVVTREEPDPAPRDDEHRDH